MGYHHPPLLQFWLWMASLWSEKEWWLRLLPALAGAMTPLAAGLWLRQFVSPLTAWSIALWVACAPNLILLSSQLRGYSIAMLCAMLALYALDLAFQRGSRVAMSAHLAALWIGILCEFSMAWIVLAVGVYCVMRFAEERQHRGLIPLW